ncbi:SH3 domain-containing protein [Roseibacillus persicicus]|uniref:SH3 domain-containing protein n=1 Tax=Roseibacillus persicicus TaxID=454148 RepID=UPI00398B10A0
MKKLTANADYEELDRNPLNLQLGQKVTVGEEDKTWPEWIWTQTENGLSGYVPKDYLDLDNSPQATVTNEFDGTILKVSKGEVIESEFELGGWHWCHDDEGKKGWVPNYLFRHALAE